MNIDTNCYLTLKVLFWKHVNSYYVIKGCGIFPNSICYPKDKVKYIFGLDWCREVLEVGIITNSLPNSRLALMDCNNIEFNDNAFDTVVDCFGFHCNIDYPKQYSEMKRVCKLGGKILLLEIGESLWISTRYKDIRRSEKEFAENGQILIHNYNDLIMTDGDVRVLKSKRKLNGKLFYYVLEKIK